MPRSPITKRSKTGAGARPTVANVAYAATITPDAGLAETLVIGTLTGALTLNAPVNGRAGDRLVFILTQDGTGSRNVTWNAAYKNPPTISGAAANSIQAPEFISNGTNWICVN